MALLGIKFAPVIQGCLLYQAFAFSTDHTPTGVEGGATGLPFCACAIKKQQEMTAKAKGRFKFI